MRGITKVKNFKKFSGKAKKELILKRKAKHRKSFDLAQKCKQMWETLRRGDCSKRAKIELIDKLFKLVDNRFKELIKAHDTARVIQCIIAHGTDDQRGRLFNQLKDSIVELTKTKYAKYFVLKMLKYGSKEERDFIIKSFYGKVKDLMKHALASSVLEYAYNEFADIKQRGMLVQEYYGTEFALFKDDQKLTLSQVLPSLNETQKDKVLSEMKEELIRLVEKKSIKHSIVHYLLREYFQNADNASKKELVSLIRSSIVEILHTKDGSRVALYCLWNSDAKDRKIIVKSFRTFVSKIAMEEYGHLVLLSVFDVVDDTKLIEKVIINELIEPENVKDLIKNIHAIKVYEYLMLPRNPKYFHKDVIAIIRGGDRNSYSKKDQQVRWNELKQMAGPKLVKMARNNAEIMLEGGQSGLFLYEIIVSNEEDRLDTLTAIVDVLNKNGIWKAAENNQEHFIEKGCVSKILKKFVNLEKIGYITNPSFAKLVMTKVEKQILLSYINCNRGCFFLLSLLESNDSWVRKEVKKLLKNYLLLKDQDSKGAKLLIEKLTA